ncbi:hypothetical protein YP72344_16420 [Yersinia pseudotuberculosis]|nr:hypothetical protein YP72344_16420 [Yersinia pseudotuberculosis]
MRDIKKNEILHNELRIEDDYQIPATAIIGTDIWLNIVTVTDTLDYFRREPPSALDINNDA